MPPPLTVALVRHPATPGEAVRAITVGVRRRADGGLALDYRIACDPARLRLPTAAAPAPADRLWAHTCCELFAAAAGDEAYREFNFSPSGQWASYRFARYRERVEDGGVAAPRVAFGRDAGAVALAAEVAAGALPAGALRLALAVVIEEADGRLGYWALRHPAARPDFHHRDGFALELAAPNPERTP